MGREGDAMTATGTLADVRLADHRLRRRMSQAELAAAAGVAPSTIYKLERGLHRPQFRIARKIAEALGIDPDEIDEFRLPPAAE
jgi:transcriptional regulator with XRE-family HTH domain